MSNCLIWACYRWWTKGGYIAARRSRHFALIPHFMWSRNMRFWWGYVPKHPKRGMWCLSHAILFSGKIELEKV